MQNYSNTEQIGNINFLKNNYRILIWISIVLLIIAFTVLALIFYKKIINLFRNW